MTYKSLPRNTILHGDALEQLRKLPDNSIDCVITSPPYWGLRDYGTAEWEGGDENCEHTISHYSDNLKPDVDRPFRGNRSGCIKCGAKRIDQQLGLEETPEEYVGKMVQVFREVRRVLKPTGTAWLNLGDSHAGSQQGYGTKDMSAKQASNTGTIALTKKPSLLKDVKGLAPTNLIGIPWRVALALQADGWILRRDVVWAKGLSFCTTHSGSTMPESVKNRPSTSHEYVFMLVKSRKYYYDYYGVREDTVPEGMERFKRGISGNHKHTDGAPGQRRHSINLNRTNNPNREAPEKRNLRSVWTISPARSSDAHFAIMPKKLVIPLIKASTSEYGNCECGSPWERKVKKVSNTRTRLRIGLGRDSYDGRKGRGGEVIYKHTGWQSTCTCGIDKLVPAIVLDPFMGTGTTGIVAQQLHRDYLGIELSDENIQLSENKLAQLNLFTQKMTVNT